MDIKDFLALNITIKEKIIYFLHDFSKGIIGMSIALLIIYFFFLNNTSLVEYANILKTEKSIFLIILCTSIISFLVTLKNYKYITKKIEK